MVGNERWTPASSGRGLLSYLTGIIDGGHASPKGSVTHDYLSVLSPCLPRLFFPETGALHASNVCIA